MKKIFSILGILFSFILVFTGCSCKKEEVDTRVALLYGDMNSISFKDYELSSVDELNKKITNKDNFLLFIYDDFCECSKSFEGVIDHAISSRHLIVYSINNTKVKNDEKLKSIASDAPSLILYKDGDIVNKISYTGNEKYFQNYAGFESYLDKFTIAPVMYYINEEQLDQKIANDETFVIYYDKNNCPFCAYLKQHYLKEYMLEHPNNVFYAIDVYVEGIQIKNGSSSSAEAQEQFATFKAKYKLSDLDPEHPNQYGFTKGWNPSMHSYKNGEINGAFIQSNEKISSRDNEGNTMYTITRSYYDDNPYVGQTLPYSSYNDTMAEFYKGKLYSFMDVAFK